MVGSFTLGHLNGTFFSLFCKHWYEKYNSASTYALKSNRWHQSALPCDKLPQRISKQMQTRNGNYLLCPLLCMPLHGSGLLCKLACYYNILLAPGLWHLLTTPVRPRSREREEGSCLVPTVDHQMHLIWQVAMNQEEASDKGVWKKTDSLIEPSGPS